MNMETNSEKELFSLLEPVEACLNDYDKARLWTRIKKDALRMRALRRTAIIASTLAAAMITGVVIFFSGAKQDSELQYISGVMPEAGGDIRIITPEDAVEIGSNAVISYADGYFSVKDSTETRTYDIKRSGDIHQITVPFGKTASLNLSDGTRMQLNSGTKVVFKAGMNGRKREIFLNGEAFLDVAHDENRPFKVKTDRLDVSVLGTRFNVKAYPSDEQQSVVLVSGKVSVTGNLLDHDYLMNPAQRFCYNSSNCNVSLDAVDTDDYTCWTEGILKFNSTNIKDVLMQLSRYYNAKFSYGSTVTGIAITGKLDLRDGIDAALESISLVSGIKYKGRHLVYEITK